VDPDDVDLTDVDELATDDALADDQMDRLEPETELEADAEADAEAEEGAEGIAPPPVAERGRRRFGRSQAASTTRAPTPSEVAVHVDDRVSAAFVILVAAAFIGILLWGLFLGHGGVFTPIPSPTPVPSIAASPSASAGASPSESAPASASPSASSS
jgi:hypothetical protein